MILSLPLTVRVSRKKTFSLNLNSYRNTHYLVLNNAKIAFKEAVAHLVKPLPFYEKIRLTYTLYPKTLHLMDVSNVCSVVDKFFSDSLVEFGKLSDDNYNFLPEVNFRFGSLDRSNPRVDVFIESIDDMKIHKPNIKDDPMQVTLSQAEINLAIIAHVCNGLNVVYDPDAQVELRATRGDEGYTASLDVQMRTSPLAQETTGNALTEQAAISEPVREKPTPTPEPVAEVVEAPVIEPEPVVETEPTPEPAAATKHVSIFGKKNVAVAAEKSNISSGSETREPVDTAEEPASTVVQMATASTAAQPFEDDDVDNAPEAEIEVAPVAPKKTIFNFKKA